MTNPEKSDPEKKPSELEVAEPDENPERGNWTGQLDFLLSCLGYAVGLGNVWRFPYLCYKHGGGAFLVPYVIMLLFIGIPCFFLELSIGQYAAMGPVTVYTNIAPLFKGMGFANFLASCFVGLYYNMIIAWTIYYMFASFTSQLPWAGCNHDFNTDFCFSISDYKACEELAQTTDNASITYHLGRCLNSVTDEAAFSTILANLTSYYGCHFVEKDTCGKVVEKDEVDDDDGKKEFTGLYMYDNETYSYTCKSLSDAGVQSLLSSGSAADLPHIPTAMRESAAGEYFTREVLNESTGIDDMGPVQWHICLCLLAAWIVIFFCLIKGIKSSGRVVYFTATFPYLILVILVIYAATLDGAIDGIRFYMIPDWSRLSDVSVWEGAAVQIFFSLSVGGGGLITLASYNRFHNNILRDTMIVCFGNCLTSVFAGFAIFSILGFMAKELGVAVEDVVESGSGLAFIAYPDLVTRLPAPPLWAFLFFIMLFTLGLDSQFAIIETVLTGIMDFAPNLRKRKTYIVGAVCAIGFLCGLPLTTRGGGYLLDLLDYYAAGWPYLFIGGTELILISYVYGIERFLADLKHIMGFNPNHWCKVHFMFLYMTASPFIVFVILIYSWSTHEGIKKGDYDYPGWADGIGWLIAMTAILAVPIMAIVQIIVKIFFEYADLKMSQRVRHTLSDLLSPTPEWRANAERARARDARTASAVSDGTSANGHNSWMAGGGRGDTEAPYVVAPAHNSGIDNPALTHDDDVSLSKL